MDYLGPVNFAPNAPPTMLNDVTKTKSAPNISRAHTAGSVWISWVTR